MTGDAPSARATAGLVLGSGSTPAHRRGRFWMLPPPPPQAAPATQLAITTNAMDGALTAPSHTTTRRWNEVVRPLRARACACDRPLLRSQPARDHGLGDA